MKAVESALSQKGYCGARRRSSGAEARAHFHDLGAGLNGLRKKPTLDAQPLKGRLISKDLRYR